jgi:protein gp37
MAETKIEWADYTFNPWIGCTKVDELCAHCYAEMQDKFRAWTAEGWGKGKPRKRTSAANWKLPLRWNKLAQLGDFMQCHQCGWRGDIGALNAREFCPSCNSEHTASVRPRVFCASLADWLDPEVPIEWLRDLLVLIHDTPNLDWLLLTKRPENWADCLHRAICATNFAAGTAGYAKWVTDWRSGLHAPENVWIGASVGTQARVDARLRALLTIPARVRFLSCEPLLENLDLSRVWMTPSISTDPLRGSRLCPDKIDWVICGGESGTHARPMHPQWARSLRDQCAAAGVPFFFKQWGEWIARSQLLKCTEVGISALMKDVHGAVMRRDGGIDDSLGGAPESNDDDSAIHRVGKKAAGRLLDGIEHNGFPQSSATLS